MKKSLISSHSAYHRPRDKLVTYYLTAYEDFTTYDENAIIELDSREDGTLQAAGYVYFQRGHVSASDEVYRSKQS